MTEWELNISYGLKNHKLKAVVEYESAQIMRIRVHGKDRSLLLENDYPLVQFGKKAIKWKLREGKFDTDAKTAADLLTAIMNQLEQFMKGKDKQMSKGEYLRQNKW